MTNKRTASSKLVLDTSCVRGTPRAAIEKLVAEGFALQISGIALLELAVHFSNAPESKTVERIRPRLAFLASAIPGGVSIAPTHAPLVAKLGGRMVRLGMPSDAYETWLVSMRRVWAYLVSGADADDIASIVAQMAAFTTGGEHGFLKVMEAFAACGDPTPQSLREMEAIASDLGGLLAHIQLSGAPTASQRFEAYQRVLAFHFKRAFGSAIGRERAAIGNDAGDLDLLQHLAEGAVVVTRDYGLIEAVDASGSKQAPWVRTVGELLSGRVPSGKPFAENARRVAAKHRPRTRSQLAELELEAETRVKQQQA